MAAFPSALLFGGAALGDGAFPSFFGVVLLVPLWVVLLSRPFSWVPLLSLIFLGRGSDFTVSPLLSGDAGPPPPFWWFCLAPPPPWGGGAFSLSLVGGAAFRLLPRARCCVPFLFFWVVLPSYASLRCCCLSSNEIKLKSVSELDGEKKHHHPRGKSTENSTPSVNTRPYEV